MLWPGETERSSAGTQLREGYPRPGASMMHVERLIRDGFRRSFFFSCRSLPILGLPQFVFLDQCVHDRQEFSHCGNQCYFFWFAGNDQSLIKSLDLRIESNRRQGAHIQHPSDLRSSSSNRSLSGPQSSIVVHGSDPDQTGNLVSVKLAQLGKFGEDGGDKNGSNAFDRRRFCIWRRQCRLR